MNQNFQPAGNNDQEPDPQDTNEPGEGELSFSIQDYPELEGLKVGDMVKVRHESQVSNVDNGMVSMSIKPGSCEFETEGQADRAMKDMSKQSNTPTYAGNSNDAGDF